MRILSPRIHGYLDYAAVLLLALAPTLFGFGGVAQVLCYVVAVAQLGLSLLTAYPLGVKHVIPFTVHAAVEATVAGLLVLSPFIFHFNNHDAARNFFIVSGVGLFLVWFVTNYHAADNYRRDHGAVAHRYG